MKRFIDAIEKQALVHQGSEVPVLCEEEVLGSTKSRDPLYVESCVSGAYLALGALDQSHELSQNIQNKAGSYWHAIMHRIEGDFWNSKYWLRKANLRAPFKELLPRFKETIKSPAHTAVEQIISAPEWTPEYFVEAVETLHEKNGKIAAQLQKLQTLEWECLFSYCLKKAVA